MKKIIITGASDGLGLALAKLCVKDGIQVVNLSRRTPPIDIDHIETHINDKASIAQALEEIKRDHGDFDALVHCVGAVHYSPADAIDFATMSYDLDTNVVGMTTLTSGLLPLIKENEADIMIVGTTLGFKALPEQAGYTAGAWGKRGIARYFQLELKKNASRVISFCPGGMVTKMHEKVTGKAADPSQFMPVEGIALCMKQILELPKYMEVSEIVINRKVANIK